MILPCVMANTSWIQSTIIDTPTVFDTNACKVAKLQSNTILRYEKIYIPIYYVVKNSDINTY